MHVDDGPQFAGRMLGQWAYLEKVELDFSRTGRSHDARPRHRVRSETEGELGGNSGCARVPLR